MNKTDNCKNCSKPKLEPISDFKYEDSDSGTKSLISGFKCTECGCLYSIKDGQLEFWEYESSTKEDKSNTVAGWSQENNLPVELQ